MDQRGRAVNAVDFDNWREQYATMTYQEQQAFYDRVEQDHPAQNSYRQNLPAWLRFFTHVTARLSRPRVLELGGWHGEMAAEILAAFPALDTWTNYEICPAAVKKSVCDDRRYRAIVSYDYAWNVRLPDSDVFVACHTIEHITVNQFEQLLDNLPLMVSYTAIEMPLPDKGPAEWAGYHGSHIFEAGWQEAAAILAGYGWRAVPEFNHAEMRVFER